MKLLITLFFLLSSSTIWSKDSIGRIIKLHGQVIKIMANKQEEAKLGDFIQQQTTIMTTRGSFVKIIMRDDTVFQLGPNSKFFFKKFKMRTKNDRDAEYKLSYGQLRSLFVRKAPKRSLKIKTPTASMGIRGTEILTNVYLDKNNKFRTDIALLSGKLEVKLPKKEAIFLNPGEIISSMEDFKPSMSINKIHFNIKKFKVEKRKEDNIFLPFNKKVMNKSIFKKFIKQQERSIFINKKREKKTTYFSNPQKLEIREFKQRSEVLGIRKHRKIPIKLNTERNFDLKVVKEPTPDIIAIPTEKEEPVTISQDKEIEQMNIEPVDLQEINITPDVTLEPTNTITTTTTTQIDIQEEQQDTTIDNNISDDIYDQKEVIEDKEKIFDYTKILN